MYLVINRLKEILYIYILWKIKGDLEADRRFIMKTNYENIGPDTC